MTGIHRTTIQKLLIQLGAACSEYQDNQNGNGVPAEVRYSPAQCERQNLSMRMGMRRFTRLTNAFSKKLENHEHALALYFMYYNFARIHQSLRVTPAMEAGVTDHVWS